MSKKNCDSRLQVLLEGDGGKGTRQSCYYSMNYVLSLPLVHRPRTFVFIRFWLLEYYLHSRTCCSHWIVSVLYVILLNLDDDDDDSDLVIIATYVNLYVLHQVQ